MACHTALEVAVFQPEHQAELDALNKKAEQIRLLIQSAPRRCPFTDDWCACPKGAEPAHCRDAE